MMSFKVSGASFWSSILSHSLRLRPSRNIPGRHGLSCPVIMYPPHPASELKSRIYCSSSPGFCFNTERSVLALSLVLLRSKV